MSKKHKEPEDIFVDVTADPFDPKDIEEFEQKPEKTTAENADEVRTLLNRRKEAYVRVFSKGVTDQEDIDFVLNDLAGFCRAFKPTYEIADAKGNPYPAGVASDLDKIKGGRREVFLRIMDFARLGSDALFLKYTNAQSK